MPWTCSHCQALVDDTLTQCWQCGRTPDGVVDPDFEAAVAPAQEHANCTTCGYPLRRLTDARCPECGTPFDAELRDTPFEITPVDSARHYRRRLLPYVWVTSWGLLPVLGFVSSWVQDRFPSTLRSDVALLIFAIDLSAAIVCPIMFAFPMFRREN